MMRIHIKSSPAFELQFPYFNNVVIVAVMCSAQSPWLVVRVLSKHERPAPVSHPRPSQLRFPHPSTTMQPALQSAPPIPVIPSCLPTNCLFFLAFLSFVSARQGPASPIMIQGSHFSLWEAPRSSAPAFPDRGLPQWPPTPLSVLITLWIVAPGYGAVSSLSRL